MYHENGVGLAAPQIGVNLRLSVIDTIGDKSQQLVLANPEIIHAEEKWNTPKVAFPFQALMIKSSEQKQ